jgi:hypothetical protein
MSVRIDHRDPLFSVLRSSRYPNDQKSLMETGAAATGVGIGGGVGIKRDAKIDPPRIPATTIEV